VRIIENWLALFCRHKDWILWVWSWPSNLPKISNMAASKTMLHPQSAVVCTPQLRVLYRTYWRVLYFVSIQIKPKKNLTRRTLIPLTTTPNTNSLTTLVRTDFSRAHSAGDQMFILRRILIRTMSKCSLEFRLPSPLICTAIGGELQKLQWIYRIYAQWGL